MKKNRFGPIWLASVLLILVSLLGCSSLQALTPTAVPTNMSTSLPTATVPPTATTIPTATPNATATQEALDLQNRIQRYVQNGYLTSNKGNFHELQDGTFEWAEINYLNFKDAGYEDKIKNFAVWADMKVSSASAVNYPEYSGCGFAFRYNPDSKGDFYTAMVSKDRVLVNYCKDYCYEVGKTRGTGRLGYDGDFDANVELIVNETDVHFLVDGQSIGEYTLSSDNATSPGYISYGIWSGTNKDYGTRCDYSNVGLWVPQQ